MSPLIIFNNKESIITTVIIFQVTMETLKRSWENFKASTKRKLTTEKQMRLLTGDGSYNTSPPSSPTPDLDSLLQKNLDIEIKHFKDSDGIQLQKMAQLSTVLATTSSDIEDDPKTKDAGPSRRAEILAGETIHRGCSKGLLGNEETPGRKKIFRLN
uniref:Uncharacterized protein n=1 Tax=Cacopsylla melanoneura TaxID=428564 RepID=A0A8D8QX76_9HEMI